MTESNVVNGEIVTSGGKYRIVDGVVQEKTGGGYVDTDLPYYKTIGCRTTRRTFAGFNSYMKSNHAQLYRYNNIEDNLEYKKSDFVAVEDETEPTYEYNDAICTYAGDYAVFRMETYATNDGNKVVAFPVYINYDEDKGTHMRVTKGDDITPPIDFPEVEEGEIPYVDVTHYCEQLGPGLYEAFLTSNSMPSSSPTHWEIIDTTTTVSGSMNNLTVNFNKNSNPVYIEFVSERGNQWGLYELSAAEIEAGKVEGLNAVDYINRTIGKVPKHQYNKQGKPSEYYVRVKYQGEYGGVTSRMINVVDPTKAIGIDTDDAGNGTGDDTEE